MTFREVRRVYAVFLTVDTQVFTIRAGMNIFSDGNHLVRPWLETSCAERAWAIILA